jgi:N4-gp56 family major capsid protein
MNTTTNLAGELWEVWEKRTLVRALPHLHWTRPCRVAPMPKNSGETIKFRKFPDLGTVDTPLREGITPAPHRATVTTIEHTIEYYGAFLTHSERLEYTAYDPVVNHFNDLLGEQCGKSIDLLTRAETVAASTQIDYTDSSYASANDVTASDLITFDAFMDSVTRLGDANVPTIDGNGFLVIMSWKTWRDFFSDPSVKELFVLDNGNMSSNPYRSGKVGTMLNCTFYVTSHGYSATNSGSVSVHSTFIFGAEAMGVSGMAGMMANLPMGAPEANFGGMTGGSIKPVQIIVKGVGSSGTADPLNQRATQAWKASSKAAALQSGFMRELRHAVSLA